MLCNTFCFSTATAVAERASILHSTHSAYLINYLCTLTVLLVLSKFAINFPSVLGGQYIWHGDQAVGYTTEESASDFRNNLTERFKLG